MLDLFHAPGVGDIGNATQDVYYGAVGTTAIRIPWLKPRGKSMCHVFMLGGGGQGSDGFVGAAGAAGGGGGGGSGAQAIFTFPLWALPDVMLVSAGSGGAAGTASTASQIFTTSNNILLMSANTANPGITGAATGAAAGGAGATATTITASPVAMLHGFMTTNMSLAGQTGAVGGFATSASPGSDITYPITGLCVTAGAGGGAIGTTANGGPGGEQGASTFWDVPVIARGLPSAGAGGNGNAGVRWPFGNTRRMANSGGSGGAGSAFNSATTGGNGGDGGWGCGGGGGGACFTGGVAGKGGNGGPGLVIITCW